MSREPDEVGISMVAIVGAVLIVLLAFAAALGTLGISTARDECDGTHQVHFERCDR